MKKSKTFLKIITAVILGIFLFFGCQTKQSTHTVGDVTITITSPIHTFPQNDFNEGVFVGTPASLVCQLQPFSMDTFYTFDKTKMELCEVRVDKPEKLTNKQLSDFLIKHFKIKKEISRTNAYFMDFSTLTPQEEVNGNVMIVTPSLLLTNCREIIRKPIMSNSSNIESFKISTNILNQKTVPQMREFLKENLSVTLSENMSKSCVQVTYKY